MSHPLYLGIEIGGTKLQLGLGRGDGRLADLERRTIEPSRGAEGIRAQIGEMTDRLLLRNGLARGAISAAGIGFGGPVDPVRGVVLVSNQVEGWTNFPLVDWARTSLGIPHVALENDADTAALGESRFGSGIGFDPLLYVTIGSGIGGGLVVDGAIYRGAGPGAIEIGHLIVDEPAEDEGCRGDRPHPTVEGVASGWSIAARGRRVVSELIDRGCDSDESPLLRRSGGDPATVTAEVVSRAAEEGDRDALHILSLARVALSRGLAHAVTLLAPRRIVLGGGVTLMGERLWLEPIRAETARRVFRPFRETYDIVPAALGEEVVVQGALAVASGARRDPSLRT